ncbi:MAG: hypothetical protein Q7S88_02430 [Candidatus Daviesbacteria bacterium]|nr:hypothetical protein [Candidatus Daviesbacteria bacterium]
MASEYPNKFQGFSLDQILAETKSILASAKPKPKTSEIYLGAVQAAVAPQSIPRFDFETVQVMKSRGLEVFEIGGKSIEELVRDEGLVLNMENSLRFRLAKLLQEPIPRTQAAIFKDPDKFFIEGSQRLDPKKHRQSLIFYDQNRRWLTREIRAVSGSLGQIVDCHWQMMDKFQETPFSSCNSPIRYIPADDFISPKIILRVGNYTDDGLRIEKVMREDALSNTWLSGVFLPKFD